MSDTNHDTEERGIDPQQVLDESTPDTDDGRPDPSDVPTLEKEEHFFQRDEDGDLVPEEDVVEVNGEWRAVKHKPPTRGFLNQVESQFGDREEVEFAELDEILADFYIDPSFEPEEFMDASTALYISLMQHMVATVQGDMDDEVTQELAADIEQRQSETGNSTP